MGREPASVRASFCPSTLSNKNIYDTSWPIKIKFHMDHNWGVGFDFEPDRIRTLVSMTTDSSVGF